MPKITFFISRELPYWPSKGQFLLENTAGDGTALGSSLKELASVTNTFPENAVGIFLDTAHAWAARYDVSSSDTDWGQYNLTVLFLFLKGQWTF